MRSGFTLLELITTLAIISLLITISYPIYTQHLIKTRRISAEVALLDLASGLERYYAVHNTYMGVTLSDVADHANNDTYKLEMNGATETSYTLNAVPLGAQKQDKMCGVLSLSQLGEKGVSGFGGVTDCW